MAPPLGGGRLARFRVGGAAGVVCARAGPGGTALPRPTKPLRNQGEKIPTPPWRVDFCPRLIFPITPPGAGCRPTLPITPPLRGSRSSQAARRRLLRWGVCGPCGCPGRWGDGGAFDAPPTGATSGLRPR
ncbi:MAG: hypothetical protein OXU61_07690, partial [Gammaproteobacteria bacterium]|nr:hypothetical protein [Gammaproteobacteria bacterium]